MHTHSDTHTHTHARRAEPQQVHQSNHVLITVARCVHWRHLWRLIHADVLKPWLGDNPFPAEPSRILTFLIGAAKVTCVPWVSISIEGVPAPKLLQLDLGRHKAPTHLHTHRQRPHTHTHTHALFKSGCIFHTHTTQANHPIPLQEHSVPLSYCSGHCERDSLHSAAFASTPIPE